MGAPNSEQPYAVCDACRRRSQDRYFGTEWGGYSHLEEKRTVPSEESIATVRYEYLLCRTCLDKFGEFVNQPVVPIPEDQVTAGVGEIVRTRLLRPVPPLTSPAPTPGSRPGAVQTSSVAPGPAHVAAPIAEAPRPATPRTVARRRPAADAAKKTA